MKMPQVPRSKAAWKAVLTTNSADGTKSSAWINKDLAPTPPDARTWSWISLSSYWWGNAFNASQWSNGASLIAVGLNWHQALVSCIIANLISSSVALALGRPGARYHVGYPVLARSVFGMYGQFFFVWIRAVVATIWFGVQSYFGSQLLSVLLRCVFGDSWWHMTNHLPANAGITSRDLLAFFLFWIIEMPFLAVHPRKIKFLFAAESIICPLTCIGVFAWCVQYGGGIRMNSLSSTTEAKGGALGWAMLNGINSCLGVTSALLVNQPDLTRYTRRPKDAGWRQASSIFFSKTLIFFFGIGATAAVQGKFGHAYWNQWDLLNAILDRFWGPAARAGCFFASFGFALSVLGVNIGCNAIPFGADVTGLVPKLFTIVRGQICCGVLSLAIVPWKLLTSGSAFLIFLGSYNCFISPICAIIIVDYFFIKRGNIHTPSLFNPSKSSLYFYTCGWNLRALGCWVCSAVFGIPGLIGAYHPTWVAMAATHIYQTGWVICFTAAAVLYHAVNLVFRAEVLPYGQATSELAFEHLAATEGYLEDVLIQQVFSMMPEVQSLIAALGLSDPEAHNGDLEVYLRNSLIQAYQGAWSALTDYFSDPDILARVHIWQPSSLLKVRVSVWRLYAWLGINALLAVSGVLLLALQSRCRVKTVNGPVVASLMMDSSAVIDSDKTGLCNATDIGSGYGNAK
ncbi:probable uracil permease [Fusarium fujikuroi IMI 58289]|uniref:Probable uracil permease n=1 Tax=Gibberella fujikuroi (strain CBS 195.34 / IMI 58289 / NRRL A-6831) TaxID=1279085 RepID=S0EEH6_GIBF5|nr:probable uracil permease [Fusarium fujikuroi IMI 58289]CCT73035.1 probable uracil permease [Fusarium fujikuroi IMI 58289]